MSAETWHPTRYRVLYADTDAGRVVYYGAYLRFFELGRTELMRDLVMPNSEVERELGIILPVVECHCRYKAPAMYDDLLEIETRIVSVKPVSCGFDYRIRRVGDGRLLVKGSTIHAPVNREGRLVRFPEKLVERLGAGLSHQENPS